MQLFCILHTITEAEWQFNIILPNDTNIRTHLMLQITRCSMNSANTIMALISLGDIGIQISTFDQMMEHIPLYHNQNMFKIIGFDQILAMIIIQ